MPLFRLLLALLFLTLPAAAQTITFSPATNPIVNPGRGWWGFAVEDFRTVPQADLNDLRQKGITLVYGIILLDNFRDTPLSGGFLADLRGSFAKARKAGVKVIVRFAYNYPQSSQEYANAKDAPLNVVLGHIDQIAPIIADNADTIAVMQAGFIGAWGEGHTSSNNLTTAANKAKIRDALLAAVPAEIPLQWRYPADLIKWDADEELGRFGMHNDCFLSSNTDVGTYSEDAARRKVQRAAMATLTAQTYFSGETCDAQPKNIRSGCNAILTEGPLFHVSALDIDYYLAFHRRWKNDGCYDTITDRMGYRLRLMRAVVAGGKVTVTIKNEGWARLYGARPLKLRAGGVVSTFNKRLDQIGPGDSVQLVATLPPGPVPARLCLLAPDTSERLSGDARFAIRFANANKTGQAWAEGAFCFRTN